MSAILRKAGLVPGPARTDPAVLPVESRLRAHPFVAAARLGGGREPHILLVPSAAGLAQLRTRGWLGLVEALEDGAGAPHGAAWRFCEAIPPGLSAGDVASLVAAPLPRDPVATLLERQAYGATLRLLVPFDLAVCREHFPRAPIVPAVVQVGWADALARAHLGLAGRFTAGEALKFQHVTQPGHALELRLDWCAATARLQFESRSPAGRHAGGRLLYEPG